MDIPAPTKQEIDILYQDVLPDPEKISTTTYQYTSSYIEQVAEKLSKNPAIEYVNILLQDTNLPIHNNNKTNQDDLFSKKFLMPSSGDSGISELRNLKITKTI
jgi:hypothetical protein